MKKVIKFCLLGLLTAMVVALSVIIGMGYKMYRDALNDKSLEQAVAEIRSKSDYTKIVDCPKPIWTPCWLWRITDFTAISGLTL